MKSALAIPLLLLSVTAFAQPLSIGDYVVVRGQILGCEDQNRILDVQKVETADPITLLGLPELEVKGLSDRQIQLSLMRQIRAATGRMPNTLRVEILRAESEYRSIVGEYGASLLALLENRCLDSGRPLPPLEDPPTPLDPIERARRMEIAKRVV